MELTNLILFTTTVVCGIMWVYYFMLSKELKEENETLSRFCIKEKIYVDSCDNVTDSLKGIDNITLKPLLFEQKRTYKRKTPRKAVVTKPKTRKSLKTTKNSK